MLFSKKTDELFSAIKSHQKMVLSTSFNDKVTSRMMSIIIIDKVFYFQTDLTLRKFEQLKKNQNVALCFENFQIEGICEMIGFTSQFQTFCELYEMYFKSSYDRYTNLKNERLFKITPTFVQKWIYENQVPFVETFDFESETYEKKPYIGV